MPKSMVDIPPAVEAIISGIAAPFLGISQTTALQILKPKITIPSFISPRTSINAMLIRNSDIGDNTKKAIEK